MKYTFLLLGLLLTFVTSAQTGGETCANATVIASLPYVGLCNTDTAADDYFASCPDYPNSGGGNDLVYEFTNGPSDLYIDINLCEAVTDYDCQVYIYEGCCTGTPIGCQEDGCQSPAFGAA